MIKQKTDVLYAGAYKECFQLILPMSVKEFYDTFYADNAAYGPEVHCLKL